VLVTGVHLLAGRADPYVGTHGLPFHIFLSSQPGEGTTHSLGQGCKDASHVLIFLGSTRRGSHFNAAFQGPKVFENLERRFSR
jgi:hypothetical protein